MNCGVGGIKVNSFVCKSSCYQKYTVVKFRIANSIMRFMTFNLSIKIKRKKLQRTATQQKQSKKILMDRKRYSDIK